MPVRFLPVLAAALLLVINRPAVTCAADDFETEKLANWHQWRGPLATGVAPQADPPIEWSQNRNLKWKAEIPGVGKSSPVIWGNRVFLTTAMNTQKKVPGALPPDQQPKRPFDITFPDTLYEYIVLCLDRDSGRIMWQETAIVAQPNEGHHGDSSYASASVTTDGERVYVSFGSRGLYCYSVDGKPQWKHGLKDVNTRNSFGEGSSPVVHGDIVVLNRDNETNSQILALNARTGNVVWEAQRDEISAWATPLILEYAGRTQVITSASKRVRSYDLQTGDLNWECGGQVTNVTPSPVPYKDHVICMSGYRGSIAMSLPLSARGDITDSPQIAWQFQRDTPYVPSPLLYDDLLYFNKLNTAIFTALDAATGEVRMETLRLPDIANVYASPVGAAGRIYVVARDGTTLVMKKGVTVEVLATNRLDDAIDASPAIAGSQMFLRGQNHLYCLENE